MAHEPGAVGLSTGSLDALQNEEMRKVMDVVDNLRRTGLGAILQLPQLVVCGDQSSGKSSVLEAITEIPFPRKENLCTRFATEIILRRARVETVSIRIIPDKLRPAGEVDALQSYKWTINDFTELPDLMDEVTDLMGFGKADQANLRAFSRDVLSIEIEGPHRPQLTLVDLPGLIHSENKQQSKDDVEIVRSLVEDYIGNQRTIILAVVSAKNDYANQIILKKARDVDDKGRRTLGIITKPDFLKAGSENERSWVELAQNKDIEFELGWHMLKNRAEEELSFSLEERDKSETTFFNKGRYRDLDRDGLGIAPLRKRLSQLLYTHLKRELPHLQQELNEKLKATTKELKGLGQSRSTPREIRRYLMQLGQDFQKIAQSAVDGHYEDKYFGPVLSNEPVDHANNTQRLRAVVQYSNLQFARQMRLYGAKFRIIDRRDNTTSPPEAENSDEEDETDTPSAATSAAEAENSGKENEKESPSNQAYDEVKSLQSTKTREQAIAWVHEILQRSRGRELPGNFNPMLISQIFWQQSEPWKALASTHVDRIAKYCAVFIETLLPHLGSPEVSQQIKIYKVKPALERRCKRAHAELANIIDDKQRHPITYNHYYTTTIQKLRNKKNAETMEKLTKKLGREIYTKTNNLVHHVDTTALIRNVADGALELDMDKFSAQEALDCGTSYYKDERKYFINVVTKQVIERCLISGLADDVISSVDFGEMTDEQVCALAAEPKTIMQDRLRLETRHATLEAGQEAFRSALGTFW
ncbi:hypothetical protein LTR66_012493 [Elasticomyces elasticus]|nr:hypothetical protein LTR66_012493 [Elasticomyces elasticus]